MRLLHESSGQPADGLVQPALPGLLLPAGGIDAAERGAARGDVRGNRKGPGCADQARDRGPALCVAGKQPHGGSDLNRSEAKNPERASGKTRMQALGRLKAGSMNGTERAYAAHLEALRAGGAILWFKFEGLKLRLADNTFYTPDFAVLCADSALEMHEVKGFWQDDARAKIKIAADLYPMRFLAVKRLPKKEGGGWETEVFE